VAAAHQQPKISVAMRSRLARDALDDFIDLPSVSQDEACHLLVIGTMQIATWTLSRKLRQSVHADGVGEVLFAAQRHRPGRTVDTTVRHNV